MSLTGGYIFRKIRYALFILILLNLAGTRVCAQHDYFSTLKLNVQAPGSIKMDGGLEVKGLVVPGEIITEKRVLNLIKKQRFRFAFTVANNGPNDLLISDWYFRAICPENVGGVPWQEAFFIPLATPYISKEEYLLLKPGEKKSFFSAETDFSACIAMNEQAALLTLPKYFTALVTCMAQPSTSPQTASQTNKKGAGKEPLDPELQNLIKTYQQAANVGKTDKLSAINKDIMDMAMQAYPDRLAEIQATLDDARKKAMEAKPVIQYTAKNSTKVGSGELEYCDWHRMRPQHPIQERFAFVKEEGGLSYYKVQFRIDFESEYFIHDPKYIGFNITFAYNRDFTEILHHFIFYRSFTGIYTMEDLMVIKTKEARGREDQNWRVYLSKENGLRSVEQTSGQDVDANPFWGGCVDDRITGPDFTICRFKENEAIVIK